MPGKARRSNPQLRWRLVWVALGLIGLPALIAILTILLLTAPSAASGSGKPVLASALAGADASAACTATNQAPVNSTRAGARATLIPPGATGVLLCRYGPGGKRVLQRSGTPSATVSQLGWELNALPSAKGAYSCPSDDGESITADFSYASGAENPVSVGLSGCESVSNGHVNRLGLDHPVIEQLAGLIPWQGTIRGHVEDCAARCFHAYDVAIGHSAGSQYANVKLQRGRFTVRVEPGRYRLALLASGRRGGGSVRVLATVRVRVRLNRVTPVAFRLSAP